MSWAVSISNWPSVRGVSTKRKSLSSRIAPWEKYFTVKVEGTRLPRTTRNA